MISVTASPSTVCGCRPSACAWRPSPLWQEQISPGRYSCADHAKALEKTRVSWFPVRARSARVEAWEVLMRRLNPFVLAAAIGLGALTPALPPALAPAYADTVPIEDFTMHPELRWRFFTDGVMGGVSTGQMAFVQDDGPPHARMTGHVSTANRGGFIQMRLDLASPPPAGTTGLRLVVRGNGQRYFAHLRTSGTLLPWQYYQASFDVTETWAEVRLPLEAFHASGAMLRKLPRADRLTSVAVVAYGRDHDAEIEVREVGFY
jgi:hypothetical protein